ncbi:MAG: hypothetical protein OXE57_21265 [Alphaproteobacteria bacterium]|nr:hypothetical protein [Alphaproteobacteria bacterium]
MPVSVEGLHRRGEDGLAGRLLRTLVGLRSGSGWRIRREPV